MKSQGPKGASRTRRDVLKITAAAGVACALGGSVLAEAIRQAKLHRIQRTQTGLGTLVSITVVDSDATRARHTLDASFVELERLEGILSRHRPGTPVARLNSEGFLISTPPELLEVLHEAAAVARLTEGAFDATIAPLLALHERSYRTNGAPPSRREVELARALVDYRAVRIDSDEVRFARSGMAVTLDGIAKGYVVDRVVDGLVIAGCDRVMVDAGGDIGSGGALSSDWRVAVQDPHDTHAAADVVALKSGTCIATSGDYMQAFNPDRSAHPIIDPRTGYSPQLASSATVVTNSVLRADALSTAALVLGPDAAAKVLQTLPGTEGLIVAKDGTRHPTDGWTGEVGFV